MHALPVTGRRPLQLPGRRGSPGPHRILMLPPAVNDPVRIILAAQIQLRRWRSAETGLAPAALQNRIREIITARETLLQGSAHGPPRQTALPQGVDSCHAWTTCRLPTRRPKRRSAGGIR